MNNSGPWTVILAGGDGTRLRHLSIDENGAPIPKQFWKLDGASSMLGWTLQRAAQWSDPNRIVPVVVSDHRRFWESELKSLPPRNIVVQSHNRGTAPAILLSLAAILLQDLDAVIVFVPSDHHVDDEEILAASVRKAAASADVENGRLVVLGMSPEFPDTELGYVVGEPGNGAVRRFVEKPSADEARALMAQGAVWNSFIFVARGVTLLRLYASLEPKLVGTFLDRTQAGGFHPENLEPLYEGLPTRDFSRDVLEKRPDLLKLQVVPACGWTDLGTPPRVQTFRESLAHRTMLAHAS